MVEMRSFAWTALSVVLLASVGCAGPDGTHIAFGEVQGNLTFVSSREGRGEIVLIADGTKRRLPFPAGVFFVADAVYLSPDRSQLLFTAAFDGGGHHAVRMGVAGGTAVDITPTANHAVAGGWAPDGSGVYVVEEMRSLVFVPLAGGTSRRVILERSPGAFPRGVSVSPDGQHLALCEIVDEQTQITRVNVATGVSTVVISGRSMDVDGQVFPGAFSPDGTRIAFYRHPWPGGEQRIASVQVDGSDLRVAASFPMTDCRPVPAWSPDGMRLLFNACAPDISSMSLRAVPVDGGPVTDLVSGPGTKGPPTWTR
jgi:Tol biopolymer transport system component